MKKKCCPDTKSGSNIAIDVNVTKIVKCACVTGVLIVGFIYGEKCYRNYLESKKKD